MYEGPENHKKTEGQGQLGIEHTATPDTDELNKIEVLSEAADSPEGLQGLLTKADREELGDKVHTLYRERNTQDSAQHESGFNWKAKAAVGASALVMGGLIYGAVTLNSGPKAEEQNNNLPPAPEPTAEAPVVPGESAAPTAEPTTPIEVSPTDIPTNVASPTPVETEQGAEYSASELKEMPLDEYKELSIVQRSVLVTDMLEYSTEMDSGDFGEGFGEEDSSKLYEYNPLDVASKDNTAEEIAMQDLYMHQLALSQTTERGLGTFDPELAAKALSGAYIDIEFTHSGKEAFTDGNNSQFADWQSVFNKLPDVTTYQYVQEIETAKITNSHDVFDEDGTARKVVTVEYTTGELPETLGEFKEGRKLTATKEYVWSDEANMWLSYKGGIMQLPAGS